MATGRKNKLTGAIGEFLVSAQLCRQELLATPFSGNVPHYDIIASDLHGGHVVVQVKTTNTQSWQFNVSKFVTIFMDGDHQVLGQPLPEPYPRLYCVFVALGEITKEDRYFVFSWLTLRDTIIEHHKLYLDSHGGIRPKAPESMHCSINVSKIETYQDKWDIVLNAAKSNRPTQKFTQVAAASQRSSISMLKKS